MAARIFTALLLAVFPAAAVALAAGPLQVSGVYPHLAAFNAHGECGIGAVVPWAGRLWYITYPPHFRTGSTDKLYELDGQMNLTVRPESVGGTHANRMIHRESNQLIIGPYFIDAQGHVRSVDVNKMPGRYTATARHLTDPANKVYFVDMEGPVWEVDVHTLEPKRLFVKPLPGWHAKGAYSGQGVLVQSNNGEAKADMIPGAELPMEQWTKGPEDAGVLGEWDGKELGKPWKLISRRQHVEVTGPGGIFGNASQADPIWSTGWDKRSVLLHVRDAKTGAWVLYRLPKASHTYDPKHGWYTEWPRIREIVPAQGDKPARLMMTMHGMMFDVPPSLAAGKAARIRPIASYLRYVPDFCHWNGRVVLATDETSVMQNPLAGISQSNFWFGTAEQLADFGPAAGWGGVWLGDAVRAGQPSDPYLFAGFAQRVLHLSADKAVNVRLEVDRDGSGHWEELAKVAVPARGYAAHLFDPGVVGEWIRLTADQDCTATAYFHYLTPSKYPAGRPDNMFAALAPVAGGQEVSAGILRPGQDKLLHYVARDGDGRESYYQVDERLSFKRVEDAGKVGGIHKANDVKADFSVDAASVVVTTRKERFRLPKSLSASSEFDKTAGVLRGVREVESERFLADVQGTFYETMRGDGMTPEWRFAKPIASHSFAIADFCTWRGLLVISGTSAGAAPDGHYFKASDSKHGLWFGAIDDLWVLGKPTGKGGPWRETAVDAGKPSDPYLMTNYDRKTLEFSHDSTDAVTLTVEVDPTNTGQWCVYQRFPAAARETVRHTFPQGFAGYWVRVTADKPCRATATFTYE